MLESVLADVLTRVLGQYLEGIDRDSVRFGAWSGLVELRGVALRPEALAVLFETLGLQLPVTVDAGFIGLLRLQVPWKSIGTTPVQIHLEDITIIARPVSGDGSDSSELESRERRIKRAKLNTDDAVREASWGVAAEDDNAAPSSWSSWLVSDQLRAKIVDNIQIHLKDISIRFEDHFSNPQRPYIASVSCKELSAVSVNEQWVNAFVERDSASDTRKLLEVIGFQIDWAPITPEHAPGHSKVTGHAKAEHLSQLNTPELLKRYLAEDGHNISGSAAATKHLLHSVDGSMRLRLTAVDKPVDSNCELRDQTPAIDLDIRFPEILLDFDDVQYSSVLQTSVYFAKLATRGQRPQTARARWVWAIDQLLPGFSGRRARSLQFTKEGIAQARDTRILYVACRTSLLKARRQGLEEPKDMAEQLEAIEDSLSFEEVLAYRDWVDRSIETGQIGLSRADEKSTSGSVSDNQGTTTGSFWRMLGYSDQTASVSEESSDLEPKPSIARNASDSRQRLSLRVGFLLQGATLKLSEGGYPTSAIQRIALVLKELRVGVLYASDGELVIESVVGGIEAWNIRNNVRMVYSRLYSESERGKQVDTEPNDSYPRNVSEALESIRSGTNPAREVLLDEKNFSASSDDIALSAQEDTPLREDSGYRDLAGQTSSGGSLDLLMRDSNTEGRNAVPSPTSRVTEAEFLGNPRKSAGSVKHIAAFRFTKKTRAKASQDFSGPSSTLLEASVATLEAVVDGPKGSFLWGLRFWKPKGMVRDPIMAFLGVTAGARIAELRMELEEAILANKVPMQINAVIMAPRFIIPGTDSSDPAFVVNMGTLGICTSDNFPKILPKPRDPKTRLARYSNYVLTLDDLGVYFSPSLSNAVSQHLTLKIEDEMREDKSYASTFDDRGLDTTNVERVIRPFSLRFILQSLRDSSIMQVAQYTREESSTASDVAKIRVRGDIPGLSVIMTLKAFQHLSTALQAWNEELQLSSGGRGETDVPESKTSQLSHFATSEASPSAALLPDRSFAMKATKNLDYQGEGEGRLSSISSYDVKVLMRKVSIDIRETLDTKLFTAVADRMSSSILKKGRESVIAEFSLGSLSVTDGSRGSTAAFRRLLYAGGLSDYRGVSPPHSSTDIHDYSNISGHGMEDFVSVRYKLRPLSNEQDVSLRFLSLHMVCVRETYVRIALFFFKVREYMRSRRKKRSASASDSYDEPSSSTVSNTVSPDGPTVTTAVGAGLFERSLSVSSKFDGFHLQLVASGGAVAVVEMKDSRVYFTAHDSSPKRLWGDFHFFSVRDLTAPIDEHMAVVTYVRPSATDEDPLISKQTNREQKPARPDEWSLVVPSATDQAVTFKAAFRCIKVLYLSRFSDVLSQYLSTVLSQLHPLMESSMYGYDDTLERLSAPSVMTPRLELTVELKDLSIRLPRDSSCSSEALNICVSNIELMNVHRPDAAVEWKTHLHDLQFATEYMLEDHAKNERSMSISSTFLTGMEANVTLRSSASRNHLEVDRNTSDSTRLVSIDLVSPIRITLCEAQYTVLYFILTENLAETISGMEISPGDSRPTGLDSEHLEARTTSEHPNTITEAATLRHDVSTCFTDESDSKLLESNRKTTLCCEIALPFVSVEISRGWDVTQEECKVLGVYMKDAHINLRRSIPYRLFVELEGHLVNMRDLRKEKGETEVRNVAVPLSRDATQPMAREERRRNFSMTYDKEGVERPSIVVYLTEVELEISLSLFRDLTYLAVPGWPFLESSSFAPEIVYLGRTMNVLLSESQVVLLANETDSDHRALALTGEFMLKIDWKRGTGAKKVSLRSSQIEVFTTTNRSLLQQPLDCYGVDVLTAEKLKRSETPLMYPTDSFLEYVGPDVDDQGRRVEFSVDATLCVVCASDIPLLKAVVSHLYRQEETYLTTRDWVQPTVDAATTIKEDTAMTPKQRETKKARQNINVSAIVPAARYLLTDDRDGRFVSVLEASVRSLSISAHGESMIQVGGEVSLDLFNANKGWWEPAIETWGLTASMSQAQTGTRAVVVRSDGRLNMNTTPTTITTALTVANVLKSVAKKGFKKESRVSRSSISSKIENHSDVRRPTIAAFLVRNELGIPVNMSLPMSSRKTVISNNTEIEVGAQSESLLTSNGAEDGQARDTALRCSISIPSSKSVEVTASEIGIHPMKFYPMQETVESSDEGNIREMVEALWDVQMINGVPVCTVRSPLRIRNETETVLDVNVVSDIMATKNHEEPLQRVTRLEPGKSSSISVQDMASKIMVRPTQAADYQHANTYEWSSSLPEWRWLQKSAFEMARAHQSTRKSPSAMSMRRKRAKQIIVCKSQRSDSCDFYITVVPGTSLITSSRKPASPSWVDVALRAPVVLENMLPGPLGYRVFQRDSLAVLQALKGTERDGAILAAGLIQPLRSVHLHFSRDSEEITYLSLAYDNNPVLRASGDQGSGRSPTEFGAAINFGDLNPGKPLPIDVSHYGDSRSQTRRAFMASLLSNEDGDILQAYAGFWLRNRSDTKIEICSRTSFYGTGRVLHFLRERPPSAEPDEYVCCEGPYISVRLPQNGGSSVGERSDLSSWWTSPSTLEDLDKPVDIILPGRDLELEVRPAVGLSSQTRIVTIRNKIWILNSTHSALQWCQASALDAHGNCRTRLLNTLPPGESQGLHWEAKSSQKAVHLRLADSAGQSDWIWSPAIPVNIGHSRELPAKMYRPKTHEQYIARVMLKEIAGNSKALVVFEEDRQNPPYRIVNQCKENAVAFRQTGSQERHWLVRAGKTTRYSWDDPLAPRRDRLLSVRLVNREEMMSGKSMDNVEGSSSHRRAPSQTSPYTLNIDVVGESCISMSTSSSKSVTATVSVDGATKVVTFASSDSEPHLRRKAATRPQAESSKADDAADPVPVVEWEEMRKNDESHIGSSVKGEGVSDYPTVQKLSPAVKIQSSLHQNTDMAVFLESIGVSVVDGDPCEIAYVRLGGILCNWQSLGSKEIFSLSINELQADNQLHRTLFPVLLSISPGRKKVKGPASDGQNIHAIMLEIHREVTEDDILMITSFHAAVLPSSLYLEDGIVTRALGFLSDSTLVNRFSKKEVLAGRDKENETFMSLISTDLSRIGASSDVSKNKRLEQSKSTSKRIYVHEFGISSTSLRLSSAGSGAALAKAAGMPGSVRTVIGMLLNVDNCEFLFAPLNVQNIFDSVHHFLVLVQEYYVAQLTSQRMKLLASNSLVGNPAALFDAVGTGARDFFTEPGRAKGSADFLASVGRGSKSLFTNTVGGIVGSVSGIPRALSSGIEVAVGDKDYLAERQRIRGLTSTGGHAGSAARNPAQGLATGAVSFAHGISSGVHGFIREPVQGAKQGGASGLLKGIGKAFIGGVAKPVAGAIDLVAEPAAGLSRQIGGSERSRNDYSLTKPDRPPRAFRGRNPRLQAYDMRYALGSYIYQTVQSVSGLLYDEPLLEWVELSNRADRRSRDSELWVWNIVQRCVRRLPGTKTRTREEDSQSGQQQGSGDRMDTKPEKTRVALVTETDVIVATLDCKLVMTLPLWKEASYQISGDGKELVVTAKMPISAEQGTVDSHAAAPGSQPFITAPWDASAAGNRRKPSSGSETTDRIACGSFEARDDLRRLLDRVVKLVRDGIDRDLTWARSEGKRSSGVELTSVDKWTSSNETEMQRSDLHEHTGTSDISRLSWTPTGKSSWDSRRRAEKIRTTASLEKTVRRLSMSGPRRGGDSGTGLRMILANKLSSELMMRLVTSEIDHGMWKTEAPREIEALDAEIFEVEWDETESTGSKELSGAVVYEIRSTKDTNEDAADGKEILGQIILEFFRGKDEAASFTTRATRGYQAEFVSGRAGQGSAIFTVTETAEGKKIRLDNEASVRGRRVNTSEGQNSGVKAGSSSRQAERSGGAGASHRSGERMSADEELVHQLVEIGFKFEDAAVALAEASGDMVRAVDILTQEQ